MKLIIDIDEHAYKKWKNQDMPLVSQVIDIQKAITEGILLDRLLEEIENTFPWNTEEKAMKYGIIGLIKDYCEVSDETDN